MEHYLSYSEEVKIAIMEEKPIVALESTIISHGMPYPQNMEMAREVEGIIRTIGAVPATIAIINGQVKIGLSDEELEFIATSKEIEKVSRRDLPFIIAKNKSGATTVAATMICAEWAGIEVFVTGGIGGVHRQAERTMDISADLQELAKTNVAVVCAGIKSILDLGLTLEYLETHGVPVVGFQTEVLPAFYTRTSPFKVNFKVDSAQEAAKLIRTKWDLGMSGGVVIANPIPERDGMDEQSINQIIKIALKEAEEQGISGKAVTPFLLGKVKDLTGGASLQANISLVKNNARLGAEIALQLSKQKESSL